MSILSLLADILFVGHSLVGPDLPALVEAGMRAQGQEVRIEAQVINGAPLAYNWENSASAEGVDARAVLPEARIGALILTEAMPLAASVAAQDSAGNAARFAALAWEARPDTQVFLYETWHSLAATTDTDPGAVLPWRERLAGDLPVWQGIADAVSGTRPEGAPPVRLIPAGQALGLLADAAEAGTVPGLTRIEDVFEDDIHLNAKGNYLVALVHVASITGKSPQGIPAKLTRHWQSRDAVISDELAAAMQGIAWQAVQAQLAVEAEPRPVLPAPAGAPEPEAPPKPALTNVTNPNLGLGLSGVYDWSVQLPFLDMMKSARPWVGHLPGQWGDWDHAALASGGWLDAHGWPHAIPPELTGISTLILTDLPPEADAAAGRYVLTYQGQGDLRVEGRATQIEEAPGRIAFGFTPGAGSVILTLTRIDPEDPIRNIAVVREDRVAAHAAGEIFNPDWLTRIRGVRLLRFMDWMATNNSPLARIEDRPRPEDYTWARLGVPMEIMVALANELDADPWFTIPHQAQDPLVRAMAEVARDGLEPRLRAHVEYSNEVWNFLFDQARWAEDQGRARWGQENAWLQFYGLRAAEVAGIWSEVYGDQVTDRLLRVVSTQTGWPGLEEQFLDAPLVQGEGRASPVESFDAYAVTGYFSGLLGTEEKLPLLRGWLADSRGEAETEAAGQGLSGAAAAAYVAAHRFDIATGLAAQELATGAISGKRDDSLAHVVEELLPYQAKVAADRGLRLVMYEGGTHVVGYGPLTDDAELTEFFTHLNYTPEMAGLYQGLMQGWRRVSDAPFNAFVDVFTPGKWGSWGALRHLGDDNPRWQVLAKGCTGC